MQGELYKYLIVLSYTQGLQAGSEQKVVFEIMGRALQSPSPVEVAISMQKLVTFLRWQN